MKKLALKSGFVVTVTALAWFNWPAALIAISATLLAVLYDKADTLIEIGFGPLSAKLERELSKAEKLAEQLREFASLQAEATIAISVRSGRFASQDGWQFDHVERLLGALRLMEVSEEAITRARADFVKYTAWDAAMHAIGSGHIPTINGKLLEAEWREAKGQFPDADADRIEAFLRKYNLASPERLELLEDVRWMQKHGDIKDREQHLRSQRHLDWSSKS